LLRRLAVKDAEDCTPSCLGFLKGFHVHKSFYGPPTLMVWTYDFLQWLGVNVGDYPSLDLV